MADYVVSNWTDFLTYNVAGNNIKFANPHEVNGEIVLTGDGTQDNPYIVSTYEEMLSATGASDIWKVKLIDRTNRKYRYNDGEQDIYCLYDDSLSTIDFNNEETMPPEGYDTELTISADVNGNGWTWKNIVLNNKAISFEGTEATSRIILSNLYAKTQSSTTNVLKVSNGINDSILDIFVESSANGAQVFRGGLSTGVDCNRVAINLKSRGEKISLSGTNSNYYIRLKNSRLNLDVDAIGFYIGNLSSSSSYGASLENTLVTGDIKTSGSDDIPLGRAITSCIFDVTYTGNGKLVVSSNSTVKTTSFYNSDKVEGETGLAVTNLYGAQTSDLKRASYLYNLGFPIGVDEE